MIADERITEYLRALEPEIPSYLAELEQKALADKVPIIRKDAQALLRFLLRMKKPMRILEIGTAVGFSCSYMSEFMPENAQIATIEKVPMRVREAKVNLSNARRADRIALLVGDAGKVLAMLANEKVMATHGVVEQGKQPEGDASMEQKMQPEFERKAAELEEIYLAKPDNSTWDGVLLSGKYDFIFMDAAKGQYMSFLPDLLKLLAPDGIFVTDNVLQEGSLADSKFAITRRDRTIHKRMRDYLFELTHNEQLNTTVLPVGDGMTITTFRAE